MRPQGLRGRWLEASASPYGSVKAEWVSDGIVGHHSAARMPIVSRFAQSGFGRVARQPTRTIKWDVTDHEQSTETINGGAGRAAFKDLTAAA